MTQKKGAGGIVDQQSSVINTELREAMYAHARHYGGMSDAAYSPSRLSGTDPVDGERFRIVAHAFRRLGQGDDFETVIADARRDWREFAAAQRRKVSEAPKIRTGPRAGQSRIEHKWAGDGEIEANILHIQRMYRTFVS